MKLFQTEVILENAHEKELLGKSEDIFVKYTLNLNDVSSFRETLDDDGNLEPFTQVYLKSGHSHCINITFSNFLKIMQNVD
jgi:hypothetical protein